MRMARRWRRASVHARCDRRRSVLSPGDGPRGALVHRADARRAVDDYLALVRQFRARRTGDAERQPPLSSPPPAHARSSSPSRHIPLATDADRRGDTGGSRRSPISRISGMRRRSSPPARSGRCPTMRRAMSCGLATSPGSRAPRGRCGGRRYRAKERRLAWTRLALALLTTLVVPDVYTASWAPFAVAAGLRAVRRHRPDCIVSTTPYEAAHLVALAISGRAALPWVADFRDGWSLSRIAGALPAAPQRALDRALEAPRRPGRRPRDRGDPPDRGGLPHRGWASTRCTCRTRGTRT